MILNEFRVSAGIGAPSPVQPRSARVASPQSVRVLASRFAWLLMLWGLLAGSTVLAAGAEKPRANRASGSRDAGEVEKLFAGGWIPEFRVEVSEANFEKLRGHRWDPRAEPESRESVPVTIREGDQVFTNVALHLKGAAGSFRPIDDRPALTLNFDKNSPGQSFHGLRKLSLNNSVQDPTYVSEILCRELFLKAGIPVPRATHARVRINDRDLGLYLLVEGWDKAFLRRHFKNPGGHLYDGGFVREITDPLTLNSGDNPKDQSDREALVAAASESDPARRRERLEKTLDVDRFLTFVAMDVLLWNWDGYALNRNNWRLYHDLDKNRMVFMPHGLDQMFWKPDGPILPPMEGLVARAVLQIPEWRQRYFGRMGELRRTVFDVPAMTNRVGQLAAQARSVMSKAGAGEGDLKEHERLVSEFSGAMERRGRSVDAQMAHPVEPARFDAAGVSVLTGWVAREDFGRPRASRDEALAALHVGPVDGSSVALWQTSVWLEGGRYRFEGRVRTQGLVPDPGDPRAGVGVRVKSTRPEAGVQGDSEWKEVGCEFEIPEGLSETTLVCEFRGMAGEGWFDERSLRLRRLGPATSRPPEEGRFRRH